MFVLGAGIGSAITYFIVKDKYEVMLDEIENNYENVINNKDDEIAKELLDSDNTSYNKTVNDKYTESSKEYKETQEQLINDILKNEGEQYKKDVIQINKLEKDKLEDIAKKYKHNIMNQEINYDPHIISIEEFIESDNNYDKVSLFYYNEDDILTEENEEIITNRLELIGDSLDEFGILSDNSDVVYVRNDKISTDFEIVRLNDSYQESILHVQDTPSKEKIRRRIKDE